MTFTLAVVILAALAAVALGLVVYNLLGRLHILETALQGGVEPPSRRLSREEFEHRFTVATARARLARRFDTGVVLFVDLGSTTATAVVDSLFHVARLDLVHVVACDNAAAQRLTNGSLPYVLVDELDDPLADLGVSTLPFCMVLDQANVRASQHLSSADALIEVLATHT